MELNREQIIKALECCRTNSEMGCNGCPYINKGNDLYAGCINTLLVDALSLIKELTEKVENYRNELGEVRVALAEANNDKRKLTEENERLRGCVKSKEEVEAIMRATYEPLVKEITKEQIDKAVADTVRKMRSEIEKRCIKGGIYPAFVKSTINQIAKEMEESVDEG